MITRIGIVAGEIWEYLDHHEKEATLSVLIEELDMERDLVLMSIGWLAREGHVALENGCPECKVKLA